MVVRSKNLITKLNHAGFVKTRGGVGKSVCFSYFFFFFVFFGFMSCVSICLCVFCVHIVLCIL